MLQVGGALPTTPLELLLMSSVETKVVLVITARLLAHRLVHHRAQVVAVPAPPPAGRQVLRRARAHHPAAGGLHAAMKQPPSPYNRLFREAINFYSELRPGALKEEVARTPLTLDAARVAQAGAGEGSLGGAGHAEPVHPVARHHRRRGPADGAHGHGAGRHGRVHRHFVEGLRATSPPLRQAWPRR